MLTAGYLGPDGKPVASAYAADVVQEHTVQDSYGNIQGLTPYYKWDKALADQLFTPASALDQWCHVRNRFQAERRMRETFVRAAKALAFSLTASAKTESKRLGLTQQGYTALFDACQGDHDFLGNSTAFLTSHGTKGAAQIRLYLHPSIVSISSALQHCNPAERAFFEQACDQLLHWLGKQRR